jgi:hypothetical protein
MFLLDSGVRYENARDLMQFLMWDLCSPSTKARAGGPAMFPSFEVHDAEPELLRLSTGAAKLSGLEGRI